MTEATLGSVMIVDDSAADRFLLERALRRTKLVGRVFQANHGAEALDMLTAYEENAERFPGEFPPLVVFLDINMPIMTGFEFLQEFSRIREGEVVGLRPVVCVMFSSSESPEDVERAKTHECVGGFVTKGTLTPELLEKLLTSLRETHRQLNS